MKTINKTNRMAKLREYLFAYESRKRLIEFAIVFFFIFGVTVSFGFKYWPSLDDYIHYPVYKNGAHNTSSWDLISLIGLATSRPLASPADIFVWSKMSGFLIAASIILALMYSASEVLLHKAFERYFGTGYLFTVVFCLLPVSMEGLYWISASTRIICGVFFASIALSLFERLQRKFSVPTLILFAVMQFIGYCFYEQTLALSLGLIILSMLMNRKKTSLWGLLSFASAGGYFCLLKLNSIIAADSKYTQLHTQRTELFLPILNKNYFSNTIKVCFEQIKTIFVNADIRIFINGLKRAIGFISEGKMIIFTVFIVILSVITLILLIKESGKSDVLLIKESEKSDKKHKKVIILFEILGGVFLFIATLGPYLVIENPYIAMRAAASCLCGAGLIADGIVRLITFDNKKIMACICVAVAMLFSIVCATEIHDYRENYNCDTDNLTAITDELKTIDSASDVAILNLNASYVSDQNYFYKDHISGITSSRWALKAACKTYGVDINSVTPIPLYYDIWYYSWDKSMKQFDNFDVFYYYDYENKKMIPISVEKTDNGYDIIDANGNTVGIAYERSDGAGIIKMYF